MPSPVQKSLNKPIGHFFKNFFFLLIVLSVFVFFTACGKEPIKIGFIAPFSTDNSQHAIDARNDAEYYFNQVNTAQGIKERKIEIVVKDSKGNNEIAIEEHKLFIEEGVHFVVGDIISEMAASMMSSNSSELLFISPTISSTLLSSIDDYFLRTSHSSSRQAEIFYEYAEFKNVDDLVIIYDISNHTYSEDLAKRVEAFYSNSNLNLKGLVAFDSRNDDLETVVEQAAYYNPKNVFIISASVNTAYIVQNLKQNLPNLGVFSVSWSMTKDFIENGGSYVKGTIFVGIYVPENNSKEYEAFAAGFKDYYGYEPSFVSSMGYDAAYVLAEGIKTAKDITPAGVKEAIIQIGTFEGIRETFTIDRFGDNNKQYMMYILEGDSFVPLREW